ncbi:MAG: transposase [Anaerohalosphaeraceae bacterium]|nr:transposase [Anaerohalosphaeraceae bacterium]
MESELFRKVYQIIMDLYRKTKLKRAKFTDADIVKVYLWAVLHDRPTCWACKKKNWPVYHRRQNLPDASTMSRRLRTVGVQKLLRNIEEKLKDTNQRNICRWIDAKGLLISNSSGDKQAGYGYAGGGMGKGYKLYAIADSRQGFVNWKIRPMNFSESKVARELVNEIEPQGYLIGDSAYDKNALYDLAGSKSIRLIARRYCRKARGIGHRKHSPYRLDMLKRLDSKFVDGLIRSRVGIEHMFGHLCNLSFGLKPLPSWVCGLFRVENWVRSKLIFYAIWKRDYAQKDF